MHEVVLGQLLPMALAGNVLHGLSELQAIKSPPQNTKLREHTEHMASLLQQLQDFLLHIVLCQIHKY